MSNLFPILKNRSELEIQKNRGMYIDSLLEDGISNKGPFIMYGEDTGGAIAFSPSEGGDEDYKIKQKALNNLRSLKIEPQVQEIDGVKFAVVEHEYAAEKILDSEFLIGLASALDSESIAVGIPMKCTMVVAPKEAAGKLLSTVLDVYDNFQTYPISNAIYWVTSGKIVAVSN